MDVLVPFHSIPAFDEMPDGWKTTSEVTTWLQQEAGAAPVEIDGVPVGGLAGGLLIRRTARDPGAVVAAVADVVETFRSRVEIGSKHDGFKPVSAAFVSGSGRLFPLRPQRGLEIRALERQDQLFARPQGGAIDSAIELVSLLDGGSPSAAIAGAWAAVESLLKAPGDGGAHKVAPRLAALVTCSFARAELTSLAWRQIRRPGKDDAARELAKELRDLGENGPRSARVAELLLAGQTLGLLEVSDVASEQRLLKLLRAPRSGINEILKLVEDPLARFYRQRNLVLHAGRTDAVALRATLRTTTPLIGAALDRIAHAQFVNAVEPIRLAAVAGLRLERLETPEATPLATLLD